MVAVSRAKESHHSLTDWFMLRKPHSIDAPFNDGSPCNSPSWEAGFQYGETFDVADDLEKGIADAAVQTCQASRVKNPVRPTDKLLRHSIFYKEETDEYHLLSETGEFMLVAQRFPQEHRFEFFTEARRKIPSATASIECHSSSSPMTPSSPSGGQRRRPAFVMVESGGQWVLTQPRCEHCTLKPRHLCCEYVGKAQQVARIRHSKLKHHSRPMHNLNVHVPPLVNESRSAVWCPLQTGRDLGIPSPSSKNHASSSSSPGGASCSAASSSRCLRASGDMSSLDLLPGDEDDALLIQSVLPTWDSEVESLVLNFKSRSVISSSRNFMMRCAEDKEGDLVLQHAMMRKNMWCLDFMHPLSVVQAFGIGLSSIGWD